MIVKSTALFIVFAACIAAVPGHGAPDHLQPDFSTIFGWRVEHPYRLAQILLAGQDERTLAAVVIPSSSREWALLVHPAVNEHAQLELRVADSSIWSSLSDGLPPPGFKTFKQPLSITTETTLRRVWERFLLSTRYPSPGTEDTTLDGTIYEFALYGGSPMAGSVSNPHPCTQPGKLVDLLSALRRLALVPQPGKPREEASREKALVLLDASKLEASISECKKHQAEAESTDAGTRRIEDALEGVVIQQYCTCGRWPSSLDDFRNYYEGLTARRRRADPNALMSLQAADYEDARISIDRSGKLLLAVPKGYQKEVEIPECPDLRLSPDTSVSEICPESHPK